jgi:cytochrome b561
MSASGRAVDRGRYSTAAMTLHWLVALAIVGQVCLGWYMNEVLEDHTPAQALAESTHISLGLTILLLVLARIAVRFMFRTPPEPEGMPAWERWLARLSHFLFYAIMLVLPLSGWTLVSLGQRPIQFWGLPWPHLPGVGAVFGSPATKDTREALAHFHVFIMIWIVVATLALHVAGALYHQFHRPRVLWRMVPFLAPPATSAPAPPKA